MPKYLSGRVKRRNQAYLSTDRYQFLGLDQAEPNLGDSPSLNGSLNIPAGQQYQIVSLIERPGERFWVPIGGGIIPGSISVFDEGSIVGTLNSITQLNFVGSAITASSTDVRETTLTLKNSETFSFTKSLTISQDSSSALGVVKFATTNSGIVTLTSVSGTFDGTGVLKQDNVAIGQTPTGAGTVEDIIGVGVTIKVAPAGNENEVLFVGSDDFSTDTRFSFVDGLLNTGDKIAVGIGGTVITTTDTGKVGIGSTTPIAKLDMNVGSAFTAVNVTGTEGQLLLITDDITSGSIFAVNDVSGMPSIDVDATGTIQLAPFGENEFVGIGTTNPTSKLHVIGDTNLAGNLNVSGISTFVGFSTFKNSINVSGVSTFHNEIHLNDTLRVFDNSGDLAFGVFPDFPGTNGRAVANEIQIAELLDVNGNVDVDGHTELDNLNVAGVSTFAENIDFLGNPAGIAQTSIQFHKGDGTNSNLDALNFYDNAAINVGKGHTGQIQIRGNYNSTGANPTFGSYILATGDNFFIDGGQSTSIKIRTQFARNAIIANSDNGGSGTVELYHSSGGTATKKFETSGIGATVYGQLDTTDLNVSGVSTFSDDIFIGVGATVGFGTTAYFSKGSTGIRFDTGGGSVAWDHGPTHGTNITSMSYVLDGGILGSNWDDIFWILDQSKRFQIGSSGIIQLGSESGAGVWLRADSNSTRLYHSASYLNLSAGLKLETSGIGVTVYGRVDTDSVLVSGTTTTRDFKATGVSTFTGNIVPATNNTVNIGESTNLQFNKIFANEFIGQINTVQENQEVGNLQVNGISTFIGVSTFADGIHVVSGIATFDGNIDANGNLDVDGQTDLDVLNVSDTATFSGSNLFNGGVTAVSGFQLQFINPNNNTTEGIISKFGYTSRPASGSHTGGAKIQFGDAARASFGGVDDFEIYHGGGVDHNYIDSRKFGSASGTGILKIRTNQRDAIVVNNNGSVELYDASTNPSIKRLETTNSGVSIFDNLHVAGVSTFVGDAEFNGNVSIAGTLTYEDVTNVDSIGIITARKDVHVGAGLSVVGVASATSFESTVATGTAPFVVASTTKVINLNADLLDGFSTANGAAPNSVVVRNAAAGFSAADVTFEDIVGTALSISGITTLSGNAEFRGDLTTFVGSGTGAGNGGAPFAIWSKANNYLWFSDATRILMGFGQHLEIKHSDDESIIRDTRAGVAATLAIGADKLILRNKDGNEPYLEASDNGSVKLYNDFIPKFETSGIGATVYGQLDTTNLEASGIATVGLATVVGNAGIGSLNVTGVSTFVGRIDALTRIDIGQDGTAGRIRLSNGVGSGFVYQILNVGGNLTLRSSNGGVQADDNIGRKLFFGSPGGAFQIYHAGYSKLSTTGYGVTVKGNTETRTLNVTGLSTFAGITTVTGETLFTKQLNVSGVSTFNSNIFVEATTDTNQLNVTGVSTFTSDIDVNASLDVDGTTSVDSFEVSGVSTFNGNIKIDDRIKHIGDEDTQIRFPADDTISMETAGSQHLRIEPNGNVGIGTANNTPTSKLHVLVDGVGQGINIANKENLYPVQSTGYSDISFTFRDYLNGGSSGAPAIIRGQSDSAYATKRSSKLIFFTSPQDGTNTPTEKMRIEHDGKVGIGTDNPNTKVHISGTGAGTNTLRIDTSGTGLSFHNHSEFIGFLGNDSGKLSINAGGTQDTLVLKTAGTERLLITSAGNVGIGSTIPQDILTLRTGDDVTSLRLIDPTADTYGGHFSFYNTANEVRIGGVYNNDKRAVIRIHRDADDDAIVIDGTNNITFDGNLFRNTVHTQDIGSSSNPWDKVYASEFIGLINTTQENVTTGNLLVTGIATFQGNVSIAGTLTYEDVTNIDSIGIITARKDVHVGAGVSAVGVGSFGSVQLDGGVTLENSTTTGTGKALKIISPSGYIEVGSQNTNNAHFYTDRPRFYFNKRVLVDEGIIGSFDEDLVFVTDQNEERLRIENDTGNVGIGTAANDGDAKLVIEGVTALTNVDQTVMVRDSNSDDAVGRGGNIGFGAYVNGTMRTLAAIGGLKKNSSNSFDGNLALYTRRNAEATLDQRLTILSTGEVGINDTNPSSTLTVAGDVSLTRGTATSSLTRTLSIGGSRNQGNNFASIDLKNYDNDSSPVVDYVAARITGTVPSTPQNGGELVFYTSPTGGDPTGITVEERLRIASDGKVGINSSAPNTRLDVIESSANRTWTPGTSVVSMFERGSNSRIAIVAGASSYSEIDFGDTNDDNAGYIRYDHSDNSMSFRTNTDERLRITGIGSVGIGTDDPQQLLHVETLDSTARIHIERKTGGGVAGLVLKNTNKEYHVQLQSNAFQIFDKTATTERFRITSDGNVGINTDDPYYKLQVNFDNANTSLSGGSSGNWGGNGIRIENDNTTVGAMSLAHFRVHDADWHIGNKYISANKSDFVFNHEGSEITRITNAGNLLVGHDEALLTTTTHRFRFQVTGTDFPTSGVSQTRFESNNSGASLVLAHSRSGTIGNHTILQNNDEFGKIRFYGSDGNDFDNFGAEIRALVDGTPGNNVMPGRIEFETTAAGESQPTPRMRIGSDGKIRLGGNANAAAAYTLDLGESASTIRLVSESNGTAIRMGAGDSGNDFTLIRVDGSTAQHDGESDDSAHGFSLKYMGSRSNNNNSFSLFADNQTTGTQFEAITVLQDGKIGIKDTSPSYELEVNGTVAATNFDSLSDRRYKTNIKVIENPIEKIKKIDGVSFDWKETNEPSLGVIADNVLEVLPEIVSGEDTKSVNYNGLIGVLIEVVKDQQKQIDELRGLIDK